MGLGHSSLCLGKERIEDEQPRTSQSDTAPQGKHDVDSAWSSDSRVFSVDLVRQSSRSISRTPSTEASLDDETTSVTSSSLAPQEGGEWSRKNSGSKCELEEISDPIFIVKNTFIDVAMPPIGNSRVRSSSAPPSPAHRRTEEADDACVLQVTGASPARLAWADELDADTFPCRFAPAEKSIVPPTAAPTAAAPARLPLILVGLEVVIEGLTRSPEFNGRAGRVQAWEAETGRYDVMLHGLSGVCEPFLVKVKAENIRRLDPPPPDFDASTKIPGMHRWDELNSQWDEHSSSDMTLATGAYFEHYPYYRQDYHENTWPNADAVSSPMHSMPVPPMQSMPVDGGYSPHHQAGAFSPWWLPEAR
eukprot:TRINITY_DN2537_c0_g2_i1.p1 TRINITY_DN2537_c0_g2~~TRINITY_DN2537_c0_g2_i1.p1  ORF type:complete len:362 (+),score=47.53 TRINITY_DN2537_c0_g2_i1:87-1172(+)